MNKRKSFNRKKKIERERRKKQLATEAEERRRELLFSTTRKKPKFVEYKPKQTRYVRETEHDSIPSKMCTSPAPELHRSKPKYEGEMLERDLEAQREIEIKRNRVAPHYSKGPYQYITDETPIEDLGRKK